jgi:class 3 adenylate cyclase
LVAGERVERRLAAVVAADIAGYSRLMGVDEVGTLEALKKLRREVVDPAITQYHGRIVKTTGDGMLVEFASAVDAVNYAVGVQAKMAERNADAAQAIIFRIGINVGDIIIDGDDIFGDGVNVAARVENECEPGSVYLSGNAFEQVRGKADFVFEDLGERSLKNMERPVRLYAARSVPSPGAVGIKMAVDPAKPLALPDRPSIAVLPFQNMSGDPEQEYFSDGIVEDIITALSRFKSLFVIALARLQQAMRASPHDPLTWLWTLWTGMMHFLSHRFDAAMDTYRQVIHLRPSYIQGYVLLAASLAHLGRIDEARKVLKHARAQAQDVRFQNPPWLRPEDNALRLEGIRLAETPE